MGLFKNSIIISLSLSLCVSLCFSIIITVSKHSLSYAQAVSSNAKSKGLKNHQAALKLAELISTVYELQRADESSDQVKFVIRETLDEQSLAGYHPIDVWGSLPKQKPRETAQLVSKLWKQLKRKSSTPDMIRKTHGKQTGVMTHEHLQLLLDQLFTPSVKNSQRFRKLKKNLVIPQDGPLRNGTGLLETSYSLALKNMVHLPFRLRRWRKKYVLQTQETIKLFKQSLKYLRKLHRRGELVSSEQWALIQLSLGTCYLALGELKPAQKHLRLFFQVPSPGESILMLRGLIVDLSRTSHESEEEIEVSAENLEYEPNSNQKSYNGLLKSLKEWSGLLHDERQRFRQLKGQARDILQETNSVKAWWAQEIKRSRQALRFSESNLALEQLLTALIKSAQSNQMIALGSHPIKWVRLPAGQLWVEADTQADQIGKTITFEQDFWIAESEITVAQYEACVKEGVCSEIHWSHCDRKKIPNDFRSAKRPAVCVTWEQARDFARWVDADLPSEAEWQYAAQGSGQSIPYPWGHEPPSCERSVYRDESGPGCGYTRTWDVCTRSLGNTSQGLCDMSGNVWEWVLDAGRLAQKQVSLPTYREDGKASCPNSNCESKGNLRIAKGGGWESQEGLLLNSTRAAFKEQAYHSNLGFRPVRHSPP